MLWPYLTSLLLVGGCGRAEREPAPPARAAIEVRDGAGAVVARVAPGRPCRAVVEGVELIVGADPLVAQQGAAAWTAARADNGTTFLRDGAPVARLHANQLFDAGGLPLVRVLHDGGIAGRDGAVARRAAASPATNATNATGAVTIGDGTVTRATVTGTTDVVLAALLAAPEVTPDVRAIAACYLLHSEATP